MLVFSILYCSVCLNDVIAVAVLQIDDLVK